MQEFPNNREREESTPREQSWCRAWLLATRPKTLAASIVPVVLGCQLAFLDGEFKLLPALALLSAALLIQIASNFSNDVADFEKGADSEGRLGPQRAVQAGLISPIQMKRATLLTVLLALMIGLYLVSLGGLPILLIGVLALFFAWGYTSGPFPLAYIGLGEVFVMLFFGPTAVVGTYYVFAGKFSIDGFLAGISSGSIACAILVVNNLRDRASDSLSNKKTLAVRFGESFAEKEYVFFLSLAALAPLSALLLPGATSSSALGALYLLFAWPLIPRIFSERGQELNYLLADTAKQLIVFALFYGTGLILNTLFAGTSAI